MPDHLAPVPDEPVAKAAIKWFGEMGNHRLHHPWGYDRLEFLPQLRGRRGSEIYREMARNDAVVAAVLFHITALLRRVEWEVEPTASGENGEVGDEDIERADFLNSAVEDMSHSWEEFIADALTMLPYGFAFMEVVYKHREDTDMAAPGVSRTRFPDGKVGWRKFVLIPPETIQDFDVDDHGGVLAARQQGAYGESMVTIPIEKGLLFRTDRSNPRGTSVLRSAVESWFYRKSIRKIEAVGIERDTAGIPVIYLDVDAFNDATRYADYQKIVRNLRNDEQAGVLLPAQVTDSGTLEPLARLDLLATAGTRQFNTNEIIGRYTREIAMTLMQDVMLLGHEKVGTQALASEKRDLSDTALQAWLNDISAVINDHAVPRLFALNGESLDNLPKLVPGELRPTDVAEFAAALKDIAAAGFMVSGDPEVENEVRRRLGLPMVVEEVQQRMADELLEPPAPPPPAPPPPPVPMPPAPEPEPAPTAKARRERIYRRDGRLVTIDKHPEGAPEGHFRMREIPVTDGDDTLVLEVVDLVEEAS